MQQGWCGQLVPELARLSVFPRPVALTAMSKMHKAHFEIGFRDFEGTTLVCAEVCFLHPLV